MALGTLYSNVDDILLPYADTLYSNVDNDPFSMWPRYLVLKC